MQGKIIKIKAVILNQRLKICGIIQISQQMCIEAYLPAREMAALLPREVLMGGQRKAGGGLLETIKPIIRRLVCGRTAKIWTYGEQNYFAFLPWGSVSFESGPATAASGSQKQPQHSGSV